MQTIQITFAARVDAERTAALAAADATCDAISAAHPEDVTTLVRLAKEQRSKQSLASWLGRMLGQQAEGVVPGVILSQALDAGMAAFPQCAIYPRTKSDAVANDTLTLQARMRMELQTELHGMTVTDKGAIADSQRAVAAQLRMGKAMAALEEGVKLAARQFRASEMERILSEHDRGVFSHELLLGEDAIDASEEAPVVDAVAVAARLASMRLAAVRSAADFA